MILVHDIYTEVCDALLEPIGLTEEILTEDMFLELVNQAVSDFLTCGAYEKAICIRLENGERVYTEPLEPISVRQAAVAESLIQRNSGFYWDQSDANWENNPSGNPQEWRKDQLNEVAIEVRPAPDYDGEDIAASASLYGTISSASGTLTIGTDASFPSGLLGTIANDTKSPVFIEVLAPLYGTISAIVSSGLNITEFGSYQSGYRITDVNDVIESIDSAFRPYLVMSVLKAVHTGDSESKSIALGKYYTARVAEAINLISAIADESLD